MNRPTFTKEQEYWICNVIGDWYIFWKNNLCDPAVTHRLGFAKENLKALLCDDKEFFEPLIKEEIKKECECDFNEA